MAIDTLRAVGYCAHYSRQGEWAFKFALGLAQQGSLKLNVFHFLADPYDPNDTTGQGLSSKERNKLAIERERELRLHFDELAGDYLEVGFRLCFDNEWTELHRCLVIREFQVLVLGYPSSSATFADKPIREFAESFISPVILVGPDSPDELYLNKPAALLAHKLGLEDRSWNLIDTALI